MEDEIITQARPAVLLYGDDFDPSREDSMRDFVERVGAFDEVRWVALNSDHITEHDLPPQMGKATDRRAAAFVPRHGEPIQVELDALPPDQLRNLYQQAIDEFWDTSTYQDVLDEEAAKRAALGDLAPRLAGAVS